MFVRALAIALMLCVSVSEAQPLHRWERTSQLSTRDLLKMSFLDSLRGWVCGREGIIFKTTDGGKSWTPQNSHLTADINDLYMVDDRHGYALSWIYFMDTSTYHGSRILKTTDGGDTWTSRQYPVNGKYFHTITFFDSLNGWIAGEEGEIAHTTDGGENWVKASVDSSFHMRFSVLNLTFYSRQYGFGMGGALDFAGVMWRTTNGGENWRADGIAPEPVYEVYYLDSLDIIGIAGDFDFGASMVRTADGGERWEYTYLGIFGQPRGMSFRTRGEGWVPIGNQIMRTVDTARTWSVTDTLGFRTIYDLVFTDSLTGYAVADSGYFYKYTRTTTGVEEGLLAGTTVPRSVQLHQNYPNPFNPATTISYTLGSRQDVELSVLDPLGRTLDVLVRGQKEAGTHFVSWNAREYSSGVYFYRLRAGSSTTVKRMLLMR